MERKERKVEMDKRGKGKGKGKEQSDEGERDLDAFYVQKNKEHMKSSQERDNRSASHEEYCTLTCSRPDIRYCSED